MNKICHCGRNATSWYYSRIDKGINYTCGFHTWWFGTDASPDFKAELNKIHALRNVKIVEKEPVRIDLGEHASNSHNNHINMLTDAEHIGFIFCDKPEYKNGEEVLLMHSGLIKVTGIKTDDRSIILKVVMNHNKNKRKMISTVTHRIYSSILQAEDELTKL